MLTNTLLSTVECFTSLTRCFRWSSPTNLISMLIVEHPSEYWHRFIICWQNILISFSFFACLITIIAYNVIRTRNEWKTRHSMTWKFFYFFFPLNENTFVNTRSTFLDGDGALWEYLHLLSPRGVNKNSVCDLFKHVTSRWGFSVSLFISMYFTKISRTWVRLM